MDASASSSWHAPLLWSLLAAFAGRVLAQLVVALVPVPFLPAFEEWHSATLPYPVLLVAQLAILFVLTRIALEIGQAPRARPRRGRWLSVAGSIYLVLMLARLGLGRTVLADVRWFDAPIPTLFHLVLAAFLLVAGHQYRTVRTDS